MLLRSILVSIIALLALTACGSGSIPPPKDSLAYERGSNSAIDQALAELEAAYPVLASLPTKSFYRIATEPDPVDRYYQKMLLFDFYNARMHEVIGDQHGGTETVTSADSKLFIYKDRQLDPLIVVVIDKDKRIAAIVKYADLDGQNVLVMMDHND